MLDPIPLKVRGREERQDRQEEKKKKKEEKRNNGKTCALYPNIVYCYYSETEDKKRSLTQDLWCLIGEESPGPPRQWKTWRNYYLDGEEELDISRLDLEEEEEGRKEDSIVWPGREGGAGGPDCSSIWRLNYYCYIAS